MSTHVLLNSLNELGKSDEMRGFRAFYHFFSNKFNKFKSTDALRIDCVVHMTYDDKNYFVITFHNLSSLEIKYSPVFSNIAILIIGLEKLVSILTSTSQHLL